jgi:hypothetical protein
VQGWDQAGQLGIRAGGGAGVARQGCLQEATPWDVQQEMQQLAVDATQLVRLQQVLQMLHKG